MVQIISNQLWWHFLQLESVPAPYQESWILRRPPCATTIAPHSLILPLVSEVMSTYIVYILWRGIVNVSDTLVENFGSCNPGCCLRGETADGKSCLLNILSWTWSHSVSSLKQFVHLERDDRNLRCNVDEGLSASLPLLHFICTLQSSLPSVSAHKARLYMSECFKGMFISFFSTSVELLKTPRTLLKAADSDAAGPAVRH